jgi:hypothetical protein
MAKDINIHEVMQNITLHVTGIKRQGVRNWIGARLFILGAWVIGTPIEIGTAAPKKRIRLGKEGEPPVAYDLNEVGFNYDIGSRLRVFVDGVLANEVIAYDTEDGWVETLRLRKQGNVTVAWEKQT